MNTLIDLFPAILFYLVWKLFDIYLATIAAMVASVLQVAWGRWRHGRFNSTHVIVLLIVLVGGAATLLLHDPAYLRLKVSVIHIAMGLLFVGSLWVGGKTMFERMLGEKMTAPPEIWRRMSAATGVFYIVVGVIHQIVAPRLSEKAWMNLKLFGLTGINLVFIVLLMLVFQRHLVERTEDKARADAGPGGA